MTFGSDVVVTASGKADTVEVNPSHATTIIEPAPAPVAPPAAPLPLPRSVPNRAWQNAAGKHETSAPLEKLPVGLALGDEVDEPVSFDEARKLLVYRGFMCHGSYLYLRHLSDDLTYLAALDQLYVKSANQDLPGQGTNKVLLAALASGAALVTAALGWLLR